jgi:hypothetical protein
MICMCMRSLVTLSFLVAFTLGCTATEPAPPPAPSHTSSEVCAHLLDLYHREPNIPALSDADATMFTDECVREFDIYRRKLSAEKYNARVACVMALTEMVDSEIFMNCEERM